MLRYGSFLKPFVYCVNPTPSGRFLELPRRISKIFEYFCDDDLNIC